LICQEVSQLYVHTQRVSFVNSGFSEFSKSKRSNLVMSRKMINDPAYNNIKI